MATGEAQGLSRRVLETPNVIGVAQSEAQRQLQEDQFQFEKDKFALSQLQAAQPETTKLSTDGLGLFPPMFEAFDQTLYNGLEGYIEQLGGSVLEGGEEERAFNNAVRQTKQLQQLTTGISNTLKKDVENIDADMLNEVGYVSTLQDYKELAKRVKYDANGNLVYETPDGGTASIFDHPMMNIEGVRGNYYVPKDPLQRVLDNVSKAMIDKDGVRTADRGKIRASVDFQAQSVLDNRNETAWMLINYLKDERLAADPTKPNKLEVNMIDKLINGETIAVNGKTLSLDEAFERFKNNVYQEQINQLGLTKDKEGSGGVTVNFGSYVEDAGLRPITKEQTKFNTLTTNTLVDGLDYKGVNLSGKGVKIQFSVQNPDTGKIKTVDGVVSSVGRVTQGGKPRFVANVYSNEGNLEEYQELDATQLEEIAGQLEIPSGFDVKDLIKELHKQSPTPQDNKEQPAKPKQEEKAKEEDEEVTYSIAGELYEGFTYTADEIKEAADDEGISVSDYIAKYNVIKND